MAKIQIARALEYRKTILLGSITQFYLYLLAYTVGARDDNGTIAL